MTAQNITINELWALTKQHSTMTDRELPKINGDKKMTIDGKEIFFYIDNEPILYYTIGKNEEKYKLYIDCIELYKLDEYSQFSDAPVVEKNTLTQTIKQTI